MSARTQLGALSLALLLLTSACAPSGSASGTPEPAKPSPSPQPQPTTPPVSPTPPPTTPPTAPTTPSKAAAVSLPSGSESAVANARRDLAATAGVSEPNIQVLRAEEVEWPDSSLGCPQPGRMYAQVITPGYRLVLEAGGKTYEYHSDKGGRVVTC